MNIKSGLELHMKLYSRGLAGLRLKQQQFNDRMYHVEIVVIVLVKHRVKVIVVPGKKTFSLINV